MTRIVKWIVVSLLALNFTGVAFASKSNCVTSRPGLMFDVTSHTGVPGAVFTYYLTIKDNDSSSCPITTFGLIPIVSQEVILWVNESIILAPGQTEVIPVRAQSQPNAPVGNYPIEMVAYNTTNVYSNIMATTNLGVKI